MAARAFVLDASVTLAWCFEDESNEYTDAILESLEFTEAFVPSVWPLEVTNALLVAERRKKLTKAASVRFLELLQELPIAVEQELPEKIFGEIISKGTSPVHV